MENFSSFAQCYRVLQRIKAVVQMNIARVANRLPLLFGASGVLNWYNQGTSFHVHAIRALILCSRSTAIAVYGGWVELEMKDM